LNFHFFSLFVCQPLSTNQPTSQPASQPASQQSNQSANQREDNHQSSRPAREKITTKAPYYVYCTLQFLHHHVLVADGNLSSMPPMGIDGCGFHQNTIKSESSSSTAHTHTHILVRMHINISIYMYIRIRIYIYISTHTHTHAHVFQASFILFFMIKTYLQECINNSLT
jgi:hypothetical protein